MIFTRVSRFGTVLQDSILAIEDCGIWHISASCLWEYPKAFRCSLEAIVYKYNDYSRYDEANPNLKEEE